MAGRHFRLTIRRGCRRRLVDNALGGLIYISAACIVFGLLYSISGGLGYFFNMFVAPSIRATARVMPFISFFALVIVLASIEALWERKSLTARSVAGAILAALVVCAVPSVGALATKHRLNYPDYRSAEIEAVNQLLAAKEAAGLSRILQLPVVKWPEMGNVGHFEPYNHQLPFIFDKKGSTTKWSYGASANEPAFVQTRDSVDGAMKGGLAKTALALGFDGVLIEKLAFENSDDIKANLEADGARKIFEDGSRALFAVPETGKFPVGWKAH